MEEKNKWFKEKLTELGPNRRELQVEIPAEIVAQELEDILAKFISRAKIPGFRVGKAPREIVRRVLAADIRERLIERLIPRALNESLQGYELNLAVEPVVQDILWEEGKPLTFRAVIDIWPEFNLPDYKKIKVEAPIAEVKEEEIDKALSELQQRAAEFIPITDRGLAPGDYALLEIKTRDLKTKKWRPTQKVQFQAGRPENDRVLEEKILGLIPGETRTFIIEYPEDHEERSLAGRPIEYTVKILALREMRLPAINDDFARSLGQFDNLDQLKQKIREELLGRKKEQSRQEVIKLVLEKLSEGLSISLPEAAIEEEKQALMQRWLGSRPDKKWDKVEVAALEKEAWRIAGKNLRERLILEKVAKKEGLEVSDSEMEEEVRSLARANRLSSFELKERLEREGKMGALRHNLLLRKVVDFLVSQAL